MIAMSSSQSATIQRNKRPSSATIDSSFFQRDPLACARDLIGTELVWNGCAGIVVETEAYLTENDEACHTFWRPSTRAFVARNKPGAVYIYLNYGIHWMLNVLAKGAPRTGLILIRALEPTKGIEVMKRRRGVDNLRQLCSGPGKLTQAFAIDQRHHEISLCATPTRSIRPRAHSGVAVVADARIGITRAADLPWRYTLRDSPFVSRRAKSPIVHAR